MRQTILLLFALLASLPSAAQEKADIEMSYTYSYLHRSGKERNKTMILLANAITSKFYNPETEYVDSLENTPEGKEIYDRMKLAAYTSGSMKNVPSRSLPMYIYKFKEKGETEIYDGNATMMFTFKEPYEAQNWEIGDSTQTIAGYECIQATCEYHGRQWTAWFAPEIPVQDGPWKLSGLPGLILLAEENTGQHSFLATGLRTTDRTINPVLGKHNYEKASRMEMLKALRKFEDNPEAGLSAALGVTIKVRGGLKFDGTVDFLETDYR